MDVWLGRSKDSFGGASENVTVPLVWVWIGFLARGEGSADDRGKDTRYH